MPFFTNKPQTNVSKIRMLRIIVIAVAIASLFTYLDTNTRTLDYFEQQTYGDRLEIASVTHPYLVHQAGQQVAVVSISDNTYRWAAGGAETQRYLPRHDYSVLIDKLTSYGAKAIAIDLLFDTPSEGDQELANSIKRSGRVILACGDSGDDFVSVLYPNPTLLHSGCLLGHTRVPVSEDRPAIDEVEPLISSNGRILPALSVEAVRRYKGTQNEVLSLTGSGARIPGLRVVSDYSDAKPAFKIRYLYTPPPGTVFTEIPLEEIVGADRNTDAFFREGGAFRNKIVFVGDTTKILGDRHLTPLDTMPGVLIQANAAATLLDGSYIHEASPLIEAAVLWLAVMVSSVLATFFPLRRVAVVIVLILPLYYLFNIWLFVDHSYYLHLAAPSGAILLSVLAILLDRGLSEESEKSTMRSLLRRYVNPRMADHLLQHPELIGGRGKREIGTLLFSDVRGFTKLSDKLTPEELVARMNEYFDAITEIVFKHDGTAVSILGDAMLAVFGIPVAMPDHADRALAAAIEIQKTSEELRRRWKLDDDGAIESGIGINTGEVIVGEVGGQHLRSFSVYGLQVNIASRVEGLTREYKAKILITKSTNDALQTPVKIGPRISATIKGVSEPIDIYEVTAD